MKIWILIALFCFSIEGNCSKQSCPNGCGDPKSSWRARDATILFKECLENISFLGETSYPEGAFYIPKIIYYSTIAKEDKEYRTEASSEWIADRECYFNDEAEDEDDDEEEYFSFKYYWSNHKKSDEDYGIQFDFENIIEYKKAFQILDANIQKLKETNFIYYKKRIVDASLDLKRVENHKYYIDDDSPCFGWTYDSILNFCKEELNEFQTKLSNLENQTFEKEEIAFSYKSKIEDVFSHIHEYCIQHHQWPGAYYQRGLIRFDQGEFFQSFQDVKKYIQTSLSQEPNKTESDVSEIYEKQGTLESLLGKYDDAIASLTKAIEANSNNDSAYFERAIAYFEKGDFTQALDDYILSNSQISNIDGALTHHLDFTAGVIAGSISGISTGLDSFVPNMFCTCQGLANGIWAFATSPKEVSLEFAEACINMIDFLKKNANLETVKSLSPELKNLLDSWYEIKDYRKGKLAGKIIGKYGVDLFLVAGAAKGVKAYLSLRKANAILTLDNMRILEKGRIQKEISAQWKEHVNSTSEKIKNSRKLARELSEKFKNQNLSEFQTRKLLHDINIETFPVPKGMDLNNFHTRISDKGGGMRYIYKKNTNFEVRIMPANPNSPNPAQRQPYVIHKTPKGKINKDGKIVPNKSPECHIPLEEYNFDKLVEDVFYE